MLNYFPSYFSKKAIILYFVALITVSLLFFSHALPILWVLFGSVSVVGFFLGSRNLTYKWQTYSPHTFVTKLFWSALIVRIVYVIFSYFFYQWQTGQPFEFAAADALFYHDIGKFGHQLISRGNFNFFQEFDRYSGGLAVSDSGYPLYLSFIYYFTGDSIFITHLLKALYSAYTCVLIYRLAGRNFGEAVGRMSAVFAMCLPHFIYYCGLHLKETEMIFLTVWFLERADFLLRSNRYTLQTIFLPLLLASVLFLFRTVLGLTALFAFFSALLLSDIRALRLNKKLLIGFWALLLVLFFFGGKISNEVEELWAKKTDNQETSMEWRSEREGGNAYAKYAGSAFFAPFIFTIPFPTVVSIPYQENQMLMNGSNFVKNITSFFTILAIILLLWRKKWRPHTLLLTFIGGYLVIITFSAFAQSERFHLPSLPVAIILAAYGVSQMTNRHKPLFLLWIGIIFIAIIAWSWFKLSGRGLV